MDLTLSRNFNQNEKIAVLKLIVKIASSDGEISETGKASLNEYLKHTKLKTNENFIKNAIVEDIGQIASVFESKINLQRAQKLARTYAEKHGVDPDFEGALLAAINESVEAEKKNKKFDIKRLFKDIFMEFGYLWGKDDVNPKTRQLLAIVFTSAACFFGAQWTTSYHYKMINIYESTSWVYPGGTNVIIGLLIFSALCFRGYLPIPKNFRNIVFAAVNIGLLSYISIHIIGRGEIEKTVTHIIFFGLLLVLWVGIKELVGFAFIGFFILFIYKLHAIDIRMDWRAYPFIFSAFIGIGFQSANFFDDFGNFANAMFKRDNLDKELVKEGIEIAGQQTKRAAKAAIKTGVTAAKLSAGAV
jgi:hypothetical protein